MKESSNDYPELSNFIVLLFCGYVITWYLQIGYRWPTFGAIRFEFYYALFLIILSIVYSDGFKIDNSLKLLLILFFLVLIIQIPFSYNVPHSKKIFTDRVVKFAFMGFFIASFIKSPRHLIWFIVAFLLACFKMGQEGFVGQITGALVWQNQGVMRLHGSTPNYAHPNSFAGMALGTLPFIIYYFPIVNKYIKAILLVQLVFVINIVLFTGSRTGWVALIGIILFFIFKSRKKVLSIFVICIAVLIAIQYIPEEYKGRFESIFTGQEQEGASTMARIQIIKDAYSIFINNPFGVGIQAFPTVRQMMFGRNQDTHNLYLEVATNLGIQGLIIFLMLIFNILKLLNNLQKGFLNQIQILKNKLKNDSLNRNSFKIIRHIKDLRFLEATTNAVFLFIICRLLLGFFGMDLYEIYWWFAIGLTIAIHNIDSISANITK